MRFTLLPSAGFTLAFFATASVAHACGGGPPDSICVIPGVGFFRPDIMLLLPILSGTIERPCYSISGYRVSTLAYSIQANLLAALFSNTLGLATVFLLSESPLILGVPILAVISAMLIKFVWFARVPRDNQQSPHLGVFACATIISSLTIALLPVAMYLLGTDRRSYASRVVRFQPLGAIGVVTFAGILYTFLFVKVRRIASETHTPRGFEVVKPDDTPTAQPAAIT